MRDTFISDLKNVRNFSGKYQALLNRGASESCLMLVDGQPGVGKTETMEWFRQKYGAVVIRAKENWTPTRFFNDLLAGLGKPQSGRNLFAQVVTAVAEYQSAMRAEGKLASLVIDEADHVLSYPKGALLEAVRDLTDTVEIPTILVGMDRLHHQVQRWPQVARRISQRAHFQLLDLEDVTALVTGLCEVEVKDDLVEHLARRASYDAKGVAAYVFEVVEGVASIERFGIRNGGPVGRADMAGVALFNDRHTGKPVKVEHDG